MKEISSNQENFKKRNLLPFYYHDKTLISSIIFIVISYCIFIGIMYLNKVNYVYFSFISPVVLMFDTLIVLIINGISYDYGNKVIFSKKEFEKKYKIEGELCKKLRYDYRQRRYGVSRFDLKDDIDDLIVRYHDIRRDGDSIQYIRKESISFLYNYHKATIGDMEIGINYNDLSGEKSNGRMVNDVFIQFEVPFNFETKILVTHKDLREDANARIISKYNVIPYIIFESYKKDYVEKIINEKVQDYLANLSCYLRKYSMVFSQNQIVVIIHSAKWSTLISRTFFKKGNSKKIVKISETILDALEKISNEIKNK